MADRLQPLKGAEPDRAVIECLEQGGLDSIKRFTREADTGNDAEPQAFAKQTLPTLREHLQMLRAVHVASLGEAPRAMASAT